MSVVKGDKRELTNGDSNKSPTAPHHISQRNLRAPLIAWDFITKKSMLSVSYCDNQKVTFPKIKIGGEL